MSRVTLHNLDTAPQAAKPFLENALKNSGFIPNLLGILANAPAALETYVTVSALNGKSELTLPEREVVQLIAATRHAVATDEVRRQSLLGPRKRLCHSAGSLRRFNL